MSWLRRTPRRRVGGLPRGAQRCQRRQLWPHSPAWAVVLAWYEALHGCQAPVSIHMCIVLCHELRSARVFRVPRLPACHPEAAAVHRPAAPQPHRLLQRGWVGGCVTARCECPVEARWCPIACSPSQGCCLPQAASGRRASSVTISFNNLFLHPLHPTPHCPRSPPWWCAASRSKAIRDFQSDPPTKVFLISHRWAASGWLAGWPIPRSWWHGSGTKVCVTRLPWSCLHSAASLGGGACL